MQEKLVVEICLSVSELKQIAELEEEEAYPALFNRATRKAGLQYNILYNHREVCSVWLLVYVWNEYC